VFTHIALWIGAGVVVVYLIVIIGAQYRPPKCQRKSNYPDGPADRHYLGSNSWDSRWNGE